MLSYDSATRDQGAFRAGDRKNCPVEATLKLLSGKWRLLILFHLGLSQSMRWAELKRALDPITARVLTATLRDLQTEQLVWRKSEGTVPPSVSYGLTERGAALATVFEAMANWAENHSDPSTSNDSSGSKP